MQGLYYAEARERLLHRNELSFVPCLCCRIALCFSSPPEAKAERTQSEGKVRVLRFAIATIHRIVASPLDRFRMQR